jgi:drug/metabolite transporter (DMT)-like permease
MTGIGPVQAINRVEIGRALKAGVASPQILLGVFFEALFFACLLILMSKSDISFLWPLTALSFVFATFAAMWFLHERVSTVRWLGVVLIMIGAALISYSEQLKETPHSAGLPAQPGTGRPE